MAAAKSMREQLVKLLDQVAAEDMDDLLWVVGQYAARGRSRRHIQAHSS